MNELLSKTLSLLANTNVLSMQSTYICRVLYQQYIDTRTVESGTM